MESEINKYVLEQLNSMDVSELKRMRGVGSVIASRILAARPIKNLHEVWNIKGFHTTILSPLRNDYKSSNSYREKCIIVIDREPDSEVVLAASKSLEDILSEKLKDAEKRGDLVVIESDSDSDSDITKPQENVLEKDKILPSSSNTQVNSELSQEALERIQRNKEIALRKLQARKNLAHNRRSVSFESTSAVPRSSSSSHIRRKSSSYFSPMSPVIRSRSSSPVYRSRSPGYRSRSPGYSQPTPSYCPDSPVYRPTFPAYRRNSPAYCPNSPIYNSSTNSQSRRFHRQPTNKRRHVSNRSSTSPCRKKLQRSVNIVN